MPTKQELEAEINRLKGVINEQRRALEAVHDRGVTVIMPPPGGEHNSDIGTAPHLAFNKSNWRGLVLKPVMAVLRQHGVKDGMHIPGAPAELRLSDGYLSSGERWHLPTLTAVLVTDLLNDLAEFTSACYVAGLKDGTSLLKQLAQGELTVSELEERLALEEARTKNNAYKKLKVVKHAKE